MKPKQRAVLLLFKTGIGKTICTDPRKRILWFAVISLSCHFLYALYHGVLGVIQSSLWFLAMCAFYSILAVMRFCAVRCGREIKQDDSAPSEYFVLKTSGCLLLLLSAVLAWVNSISLSQNIATSYRKITMITIATYTFYKITAVITKAIRQHKNASPLFVALRNISYAAVAASVLTLQPLQRSMLASFGTMDQGQRCMMNALTGAAVCLFIPILGIFMLMNPRKE